MAEDGSPVKLYVYDLSNGMARAMSASLIGTHIDGIWHTSIVVGGVEYYYGHGIQFGEPGRTPFGTPLQIVDLGTTHVPKEVLEEFLVDMSAKYHPEAYSLLNNNCNSFSNDLSQLLTGNTIPEHITNLPDVVRASPLGPMLVGFLDSMEQRMKAFAQQGHTFRPDVQHVEQYPTPNSYAGVLENKQENGGGGAGGEGSNGAQQEATNGAAHANGADTSNLAADKTGSAVQENATKKAFEQQLRAEFDRLMAGGGLTPNEAAAQALRNLRDKN